MGKLLYFPGVENQPSRVKLVSDVSEIIMSEIRDIFDLMEIQYTEVIWLKMIRDYMWKQHIRVDSNQMVYETDLKEWRDYWRVVAFDFISKLS